MCYCTASQPRKLLAVDFASLETGIVEDVGSHDAVIRSTVQQQPDQDRPVSVWCRT